MLDTASSPSVDSGRTPAGCRSANSNHVDRWCSPRRRSAQAPGRAAPAWTPWRPVPVRPPAHGVSSASAARARSARAATRRGEVVSLSSNRRMPRYVFVDIGGAHSSMYLSAVHHTRPTRRPYATRPGTGGRVFGVAVASVDRHYGGARPGLVARLAGQYRSARCPGDHRAGAALGRKSRDGRRSATAEWGGGRGNQRQRRPVMRWRQVRAARGDLGTSFLFIGVGVRSCTRSMSPSGVPPAR
jgi:hypothetical protein